MSILQDIKDGLQKAISKEYPSLNAFCASKKCNQSQVWKFLNVTHGMNSIALCELLDKIGARISFPWDIKDTTKNCIFIRTLKSNGMPIQPEPRSEDYKAVPLMNMPVAAGPGLVTEDNIKSWVLVYNLHPSVRMKSNLIAVEIGRGQRSMIPTLHPLDIVLVDMDDKSPGHTGGLFLVREPSGADAQ